MRKGNNNNNCHVVSFAAAQAGVMSCGNLWDMGSQATMNAQRPQICGFRKYPCSPRDHWKFQERGRILAQRSEF